MGIIIWIFLIILIVVAAREEAKKQEKLQQDVSKQFSSHYSTARKDSQNSYYSSQKVNQYKKMEQMHSDHEERECSFCDEIGYKRCPQCDTMVSKKSDTCFMCDYDFTKDGQ